MKARTKAMEKWAWVQERAEVIQEEREQERVSLQTLREEVPRVLDFLRPILEAAKGVPEGGGLLLIIEDETLKRCERVDKADIEALRGGREKS